ncbi:MAG: DUF3181 family protein [Oscillatoriales cyanobacterium]|nr:MAG: DUF3181 family protein [Oscillatoriales cyanobacterium]
MSASTRQIEALAAAIADKIYIDVAKWHLYLGDAKLHLPLAEAFFPDLEARSISEAKVEAILRQTSIALGGGRTTVPLRDLIPRSNQSDLYELLVDFQQEL